MTKILEEARRLHAEGWGVHWLNPGSKAPVKSGWSGPTRDSMENLEGSYRSGLGLGVRLGEPSNLGSGFLCVIDVDLKSPDPRHQAEAFAIVDRCFPGLRENAPCVKTGRGFHFYVRTAEPIQSGKLGTSPEEITILSPSSPINRRQKSKLSDVELAKGYRVKNAWEVELMSRGKQVVLPPTLHPDTGSPYEWTKPVQGATSLPWASREGLSGSHGPTRPRGRPVGVQVVQGFKPVAVDLIGETRISDRIVNLILSGEDSSGDRSADCFSATLAMAKGGFSDDEILTVLTDKGNFLGEVAYEHRHTKGRAAAAAWVRDYCITKAREYTSAAHAFEDAVVVTPLLSDDDAVTAQCRELAGPSDGDWRSTLARGGKDGQGPPKATLDNLLIVIRNISGVGSIKRDIFRNRDFYGVDTPWGGIAGEAISDDDVVLIRAWASREFRFEPSKDIIYDALTKIALENSYHPIREWLGEIPAWDGVNRLDGWLKRHFGAKDPDEYLAQVFRKWMVASITRIFIPGTKFDWMIIFEGEQNIGKSSFGRILFGDSYFTDWLPNLNDKDAGLALQGMLCVEFGELAGLRKNELDTVKAFVTRQVDKARPPFGRRVMEVHRQCVFFGTTNREEYLRDESGNRRFNPVKVDILDFGALVRDRDQLFAEALFIFQNGLEESLYLEGEAKTYAVEVQKSKMVQSEGDVMIGVIESFIERQAAGDSVNAKFDFTEFKMVKMFQSGGPLEEYKGTVHDHFWAKIALRKMGFIPVKKNTGRIWVKCHGGPQTEDRHGQKIQN